ncbi:MAG: hypothetical protein KGZ25_13405 [Planctomycetes bacterium]|nr:hypothetical protein [Planctomycetota bacterium]
MTYDCQGQLYCRCWRSGKRRKMVYWGYEKGRDCQKWCCPAAAYDLDCASYERCSGASHYGRVVRVGQDRSPAARFCPFARRARNSLRAVFDGKGV